jgi:Cohesin domain
VENLQGVASGNATNVRMIRTARPQPAAPIATVPGPAVGAPAATAPPTQAPIAIVPAPAPTQEPPVTSPVAALFLPSQLDAQLNSSVSVTLHVRNVADLNSVLAQLKFDPKILRINAVNPGDLIQQTGPPLTPSQNFLNDTGDATIGIGRGTAPGVSGSGGLMTIVFQAVGRGTTVVTVSQLMLKSTPGQPIATNAPVLTVNVK